VATPEFVDVLCGRLSSEEAMDLVLVGRTAHKLEVVGELCRRLVAQADADVSVSYTTDLHGALHEADLVLSQVRVGGLQGRGFDERLPNDLGIPGEETVGPGGFSSALRTIPAVLDFCRIAEQVAPRAWIVNLTNPSSLVQYAIRRYTSMHVLGTCDTPVRMTRLIAGALNLPIEELEFDYVGMHHAGWVTGVRHQGGDLMPQLLRHPERLAELGVDPELIRAMGVVPTPYFRYYLHPQRMLAAKSKKRSRVEELMSIQAEMLQAYAESDACQHPEVYCQRGAVWYEMIVVPVILALIRDSRERLIVNVDNGDAIPWLPQEAIVEVPCVVGADGARPLAASALPQDLRAFLQAICAYEMLAVQAIVGQSYDLAWRALLANPMLVDADTARTILDRVWPEEWGH
jgi:6-phospho-beta-glucosidase